MGKYFGTDGFRGQVNKDLCAWHAYRIGELLGSIAVEQRAARNTDVPVHQPQAAGTVPSVSQTKPEVIVGMDTRLSGEMFASALAGGLTSTGANVHVAGVVSTPALAYLTRMGGYAFGVMISASHNPYTDNGIKIFTGCGQKLPDDLAACIEAYIDGEPAELPLATGSAVGTVLRKPHLRDNYVEYLTDIAVHGAGLLADDPMHPFAGWHIALDCANGSASAIAPAFFEAMGARVEVRGASPDGLNINVDCGSTHIEGLQALVVERGCDIGFAFDGDADRCLAVDASGNVVDGDAIMYLCGTYLADQSRLPGRTIVTTVMSNLGLYKALDAAGISYERTAVGDRFVYENMMQNGYALGGEQSGHIIFSELATTGDGLVTAIMVMEALLAGSGQLEEALAGFTRYPQVLVNVPVADKTEAMKNREVQTAILRATEALGDNGRVLVRPSGTEQLIRVMAEAADEAQAREQVDTIVAVLQREGLAIAR